MSDLRATVIARIKANVLSLGLDRFRELQLATRLADDLLAIPEIAEAMLVSRCVAGQPLDGTMADLFEDINEVKFSNAQP